jgi:GTP-binding protein
VVALNKIDVVVDAPEVVASATPADGSEIEIHPISGVTGEGVDRLLHLVADAVDLSERTAPEREGFVLHRPLPPSFAIRRQGDTWVVEGRAAERAVNLDDLTVPEAADLAAARLRRIGVDDALTAAGATAGDDVRIGDLVFTFDPDLAEAQSTEAGPTELGAVEVIEIDVPPLDDVAGGTDETDRGRPRGDS